LRAPGKAHWLRPAVSEFRGREGEDFGPPPPPFRIQPRRTGLGGLSGANRWIILAVGALLVFIFLNTARSLYVDWLWFDGVGYRSVYSTILTTRIWLFFAGAGIFLAFFGANVWLAGRATIDSIASGLDPTEAAAVRRLMLVAVIAASVFLALIFGSIASGQWDTILRFMNRENFGVTDPQFNRDIGFYVFTLPALNFFRGWLLGMAVITVLVVGGLYLTRYLTVGASPNGDGLVRRHLLGLLALLVVVYIWGYWLSIFELNFSTNGVVFGASYTDIHARLPFLYVLMGMGAITAIGMLVAMARATILLPMGLMFVWVFVALIGHVIVPATMQRFNVDPNQLSMERTYIQRNIDSTRQAFGLDQIEERPFPAQLEVTQEAIRENPETMGNIRLLDTRPLLQTYTQIQTIRPLYLFLDVDVDRYIINGVRRQVMISARELTPDRLPPNAQSWVNRRLQFTHGYGVVMSPVNEVVQEGLPEFFMRNIPVTGDVPLVRPEIYYGEQAEHYVIVKTQEQEFNYPDGDRNVMTTFEGEGGVHIGSFFRRLVFAWHFADINIAISNALTDESRILFRRNIQERISTIAPFLMLDRDPYIVVADGRLFWIQDAYTATSRYPYSQPSPQGFNYVRNSVKVVVDAYDGTTTFYLMDEEDAMIRAYARIFPDLLTPFEEMPEYLKPHIRYPEDLFMIQVEQFRTYHIRDAGVLYNREGIWHIPTEIFDGREVRVEPYYIIMRIPGEPQEEFALIMPLTPAIRQNTIAWIAARSDGDNYGSLLAFRFPTDALVFGPRQVESRIEQDPTIAAQFALWDRAGTGVIRGNLLMIPIGEGNLFIEPIYLQAGRGGAQLPELKRVIVVNGNRIAMEPTLDRALEVIFGLAAPTPPDVDPGVTDPDVTLPPAQPTPRPAPTPTAVPPIGPLPTDAAAIAREAEQAFQRAQTAQRNGDWATYGAEIARVEELIRRLSQVAGQ
jgi:uncharacterized protein